MPVGIVPKQIFFTNTTVFPAGNGCNLQTYWLGIHSHSLMYCSFSFQLYGLVLGFEQPSDGGVSGHGEFHGPGRSFGVVGIDADECGTGDLLGDGFER